MLWGPVSQRLPQTLGTRGARSSPASALAPSLVLLQLLSLDVTQAQFLTDKMAANTHRAFFGTLARRPHVADDRRAGILNRGHLPPPPKDGQVAMSGAIFGSPSWEGSVLLTLEGAGQGCRHMCCRAQDAPTTRVVWSRVSVALRGDRLVRGSLGESFLLRVFPGHRSALPAGNGRGLVGTQGGKDPVLRQRVWRMVDTSIPFLHQSVASAGGKPGTWPWSCLTRGRADSAGKV